MREFAGVMKFLFFALVLVLAHLKAFASSQNPPDALLQQVVKLELLIADATAVVDHPSRAFTFVRVPKGDGKQIAIVTFSIGGFRGGLGSKDYLAVFLQTKTEDWGDIATKKSHWKLLAYTALNGYRRIDSGQVEVLEAPEYLAYESRLVFRIGTREYQGNDGRCCPSGKGGALYRMENQRLDEIFR